MGDVELIVKPDHAFAYETALGFEVENGINLNIGLLNKFFQLYRPYNIDPDMFLLHKNLWVMIKVNYAFAIKF